MKSRSHRALSTALLCLGLAGAAHSQDRASPVVETSRPGVVVEEIGKDSALEKGGLLPGDLLLAWERAPDPPANPEGGHGEIQTVFDWLWVRTEQAPRGAVRFHGERSGSAIVFAVPKGPEWDARVRPRMTAGFLQIYTEGRQRVEAGDVEAGVALWDQLVQRAAPQTAPGLRPWVLLQIGEAWSKGRQRDKTRLALQAALAEAQDPQTRIVLWEALGKSQKQASEMPHAEESFRSALAVGESAWGESLQIAVSLTRLADILRLQNRLDEAAQLHERALEIRQRWAPDSLDLAESLDQFSVVAWARGDLETMSELERRALDIQQRWAPESLVMAGTLTHLALIAGERGFFEESAATLQRALAILERRAPDSALMAVSLGNLGWIARVRGDTESAVELLQRSLAIWKKLGIDSPIAATSWNNLGAIARERGDLAAAAEHFQHALAIWTKAAPEGLGIAGSLDMLGDLARRRGDLEEALRLHHHALEILERLAPGSTDMAGTLGHLGRVAEMRGDLGQALDYDRRALAIHERLAPGTIGEARALQQLGQLYRRMHQPDQATQLFARAVDALESQVGRLGGSKDLQATFRASHEEIYRDAIELELERGHAAEAFHLVERSRARSFLALLAERDLTFSGEISDALERSRRDNATHYDQTLRKLAQWTPAAGEEARESLHHELSRLRRERDQITAEIRKASPRLAALREPQPLDLAAARKVLDPGTLALSYSVGKDQTALFAVTREGGLRVEILKIGEERLRQDVNRFLESIRSQEAPIDLARSLYSTLIGPVADLVEPSERVLILPDGPLHRLPFGALMRDTKGRGQYLVEWKPLHTALSLTVYGALRAARSEPSSPASAGLVAFGDPHYPKALAPSQDTRNPILRNWRDLRSFNWTPLPYSRREIERIAEAYPEARLYLGERATEEQAKAVGRDAPVLHFATHGYLDDRTPLDSALVLTIPDDLTPGRDNGLLQVWEIFESVRLDADLVVLSACESALGRELSGEGMIGLTRAFQYAGARSVLASLWDVADQTTAELMARFHRHYAAGLSKDEALRQAQIELIHTPMRIITAHGQTVETDASAPFFWAAFQLFGDWQ